MQRFVFYGYLFKHDHRGISTEMYYAAWNIIRWMNDVVLEGWGEGMGTTVGRREEWLVPPSPPATETSKSILWRMDSIVPMLRAILTATTCIYPAMEAWSRRSLHPHPSYGTPLMLYDDNQTSQNNQEEYQMFATTSDPSPQKRRNEWEARQGRAAQASNRLERVKFVSRLALLSISWRGGELDPYEQLVPLKDAEDEAKVVQYVGKRTGRRSISRASEAPKSITPRPSKGAAATFIKWLSDQASSKHRIFYFYAVGELLHILRPLYWSNAENRDWKRRTPSKLSKNSSSSFAIWKAWWISLFMDLISDKLLQ
ncbi:hypothetical protein ACHAXR_007174, partial [Thalassiosira sp. AJA248-18]